MPRYAELIYNGFWFSPEREMLQALIDKSQEHVSGTVRVKLYKGSARTVARWSDHSLYSEAHVTFEEDAGAYDQKDAQGFIQLNALRLKLLAARKRRVVSGFPCADTAPKKYDENFSRSPSLPYTSASNLPNIAVGPICLYHLVALTSDIAQNLDQVFRGSHLRDHIRSRRRYGIPRTHPTLPELPASACCLGCCCAVFWRRNPGKRSVKCCCHLHMCAFVGN
jgi:hypothetical protein